MNAYRKTAAAATLAAIATAAAIPSLSAAKAPSGRQASSTQILRIFDKPVTTTLTTTNGKVISHPPYPQPQAGDILDVYSVDYVGNHGHHAAHWSLSSHLRCTFAQGPPKCGSNIATGSSLLVFDGNKLVGGTGRYQGATGRVLSTKQVSQTANTSDIVARIHVPASRMTTTANRSYAPPILGPALRFEVAPIRQAEAQERQAFIADPPASALWSDAETNAYASGANSRS
jgi:hypothetical protein